MPKFSRLAYEHLLYTLPQQYPEIASSSLYLFTTSATAGLVKGSVWFHNGLELRVRELQAPFPITYTNLLTSSTTASLPQASASRPPICPR
ncbi:MAG: hypothetical protein ACE5LU_10975 [Anaerolineae bacterium]